MKRLLRWFGIGLGVLVLFVFVNVLWFVTGKPTVSVNYVKQLNELVRPVGATEEQNACTLFIEATDLLTVPNDHMRDFLFLLAWKGKTHHDFSKLSKAEQEAVNRWVEQYYEPDFTTYQDLIEKAKGIIQSNNSYYYSVAGDPEYMLFLKDSFLEIYFPGFRMGSEYSYEELFGFGRRISEKIVNDDFPPEWNKAIAALLIKEWKKQIAFEDREILKWLAVNEPAWRMLEEGCKRDYFWYHYDESSTMRDAELPNLGALRAMFKMGVLKARLAQEQGNTDEVLSIYTTLFRVCRVLKEPHNDPTAPLVALAFMGLAADEMLDYLSSGEIDAAALEQAQRDMEKIFEGDYPYINVESERYRFLDMVQRTFTDGGIGGGHLIPGALEAAFDAERGALFDFQYTFGFFECWYHAGRNKTVAEANRLYDHFDSIAQINLYERHTKKLNIKDKLDSLPVENYSLVHMYLSYINRDCVQDYRGKAKYEAVITVLALKRWKLEKGEFPESLGELVEGGYLPGISDDPYGPGELSYRREGEDFVLYSWGADFDDDGGVHDTGWGASAGGDYVFWPIDR